VIRRGEGGFELWGLPRALKVHRRTAELMPWLTPHLPGAWDENGEQPLRLREVAEIAQPPPGSVLSLGAVVRLRERVAGPTRMERADKADLLVALAADNMRRGIGGTPDYQMRRFAILSQAVRERPAFDLRIGDDLADAGGAVLTALSE
jgi:hypothetical protein